MLITSEAIQDLGEDKFYVSKTLGNNKIDFIIHIDWKEYYKYKDEKDYQYIYRVFDNNQKLPVALNYKGKLFKQMCFIVDLI